MITIIIKDNNEPSVIQLTYENLWKEVKDIKGARVEVGRNWLKALDGVDTKLVSLVESDCLVSDGYYKTMTSYMTQKASSGRVGVLAPAVAVNRWENKFFGYRLADNKVKGIIPSRERVSTGTYPIQIGYIPGSVMRMSMLRKVLESLPIRPSWEDDLVFLSTKLSIGFWDKDLMVYVNPRCTYVTTEDYVNNVAPFHSEAGGLAKKFKREAIL